MNIQDAIRTVNEMKAVGIITNYAIGGAVGATFYLEPVSTLDVDVFIEVHTTPGSALISLEPVFTYLRERGYKIEGEHVIISGWPVQFLPPPDALVEEALATAVEINIASGMSARVFTPEHLAAIALQTGRGKDKARLLEFIEARSVDLGKFEKILDRHQMRDKWQQFRQQFLS